MNKTKFIVIGDIHGYFNHHDVKYINDLKPNAVILTGDITAYFKPTIITNRQIKKIKVPGYLIAGNHDGTLLLQLIAEVLHLKYLKLLTSIGHTWRVNKFTKQTNNLFNEGYSANVVDINGQDWTITNCRPYSFGGAKISFSKLLNKLYRISNVKKSAEKIIKLVEAAGNKNNILLAHNGPYGLGQKRTDPWASDFTEKEFDFGDIDLHLAISKINKSDKNVDIVIAGHMHHAIKKSSLTRIKLKKKNNTLYLNAARVPRIFKDADGNKIHYFMQLEITSLEDDRNKIEVFEKFLNTKTGEVDKVLIEAVNV